MVFAKLFLVGTLFDTSCKLLDVCQLLQYQIEYHIGENKGGGIGITRRSLNLQSYSLFDKLMPKTIK